MTENTQTAANWRERWKRKHNWSEGEVAKLCCGWHPGDGAIPEPASYAMALEAVRRAVRAKALLPLDPDWEPKLSDRLYGSAALFSPAAVIAWAAREYPDTFVYAGDAGEERELDTRERTTLLSIIAALAEIAKLDLKATPQAADSIASALRHLGVEKDKRTIEKHLKHALAQVSRDV